jgi:hypothetical protein
MGAFLVSAECNLAPRDGEWRCMTRSFLRSAALIAGLAVAAAAPARAADAAHPVVVELFQSQGCSSCPPANANLMAIADRPDVLALSFAVTYWDQLGWKDTFGQRAFTDRQYAYAKGLRLPNVFTPQVVVNGRSNGDGTEVRAFNALLRAGERGASGPALSAAGGTVSIGAGAPGHAAADVWLVRYDPRVVQVPIRRGENSGKTLPHRNVVRELVRLGAWSGAAERLRLPAGTDPALRSAILVQASGGGPILAAARI